MSCDEEEFQKANALYENILTESGCKWEMKYHRIGRLYINNKNKQLKIRFFNPPYSQNVKTNIGKIFLNLVNKTFLKRHKMHKSFNSNTLKLSYFCTKNISNRIKQQKSRVSLKP